jgi:ribokinase
VVGSLNVDLVCRVAHHPSAGETVLGRDLARLPGGKGANQALAAARAGSPVTMVGAVGDDHAGRTYVGALRSRGIETAVRIVPGSATGHALIVVDEHGENTIVVAPGANADVLTDDVLQALSAISAGDVLLVQLEVPMATVASACRIARDAGATVVLNPSPYQPLPKNLTECIDVLIVNEGEAQAIGELPSSISVCRTLGAQGAIWDDIHVPADPVDVVDSTGAGDAFAGALAAGLARGDEKRQALAEAVAVGGRTCTYRGAQSWTF